MGAGVLLIAMLVFGQARAEEPTTPAEPSPQLQHALGPWPSTPSDPIACPGPLDITQPTATSCTWRKRYLEGKLASKLSLSDTVAGAVRRDAKLVFLGEDHAHVTGRGSYPELFALLKQQQPEIDC